MSNKTNYSYVGISFVVLVFGILFVPKIIDRLSNEDVIRNESRSESVSGTEPESKDVNNTAEGKEKLPFIIAYGEPKKVPEFSFTDQNGKTITNKDYLGKVYVVEFFFSTCPTICPRMNANLVDIQNEFDGLENFGMASFTINPEYDTPEVLKAYAEHHGVKNENWHFMTGAEDDIYNLANTGFNLYTNKNGEVEGGFEHSGNFALIDKDGYIRSRLDESGNPIIYYRGTVSIEEGINDDGEKEEITILKEDIAKLLKE
ncbi:MAG: SCO family protein [Bacteroidetes bacterium MedPE-SWsnd-G2]|nr:MAG: SCO family protein [Bacteroidetes bacterium MedPE-SWsnd-G2]